MVTGVGFIVKDVNYMSLPLITTEKHRQEVNIMAITQRRPTTGLSPFRWDIGDWT